MGRFGVKTAYEELRKARIQQNQARLASIGLQKTISELRSITSKPQSEKRKYKKVDYFLTPLRRSDRLNANSSSELALRRSSCLNDKPCSSVPPAKGKLGLFEERDSDDDTENRPTNAPLLKVKGGLMPHLTPEAKARRCTSKDRGTIYDPILGICCHFCRQKKLCGEEDCKRCGDSDMDQPCLGKTDCSICHSSNGFLCRGCLKVRYGEEMEEVRANKGWVCPHCAEEKEINPYWICNRTMACTFDEPIQDHPHPRVRIRLCRSYFRRDELMLPICLSEFMPKYETTVMFRRFGKEYYATAYPKGKARSVRKGWLNFIHDTDFQLGDMIDLILAYRCEGFICFLVINDDPQWAEIAENFGLPTPLNETA